MRRLRLAILILLGVFLPFWPADAADRPTLSFAPAAATVAPGETFSLTLQLDSAGQLVNAVEAAVTYPPDLFEVVGLTRDGSVLTLWPELPKDDSANGLVRFVGGVPNGRIALNAPVVTVVFRARRIGIGRIGIAPSAQYAVNDGLGTTGPLVGRAAEVVVEHTDPFLPRLSSSSHPDQTRWSAERTFIVEWTAYPGAFYSYRLSRDPTEEPDTFAETISDGRAVFPALVDGRWHFSLRQRFPGEDWGPVVHYRVLVDGSAPTLPTVTLVREPGADVWLLVFDATDAASGIDRYDVLLAQPRFRWFPFFPSGTWQTVTSPLALGRQPLLGTAFVRAVDAAGNSRTAALSSPALENQQRAFFLALALVLAALIVLAIVLRLRRR